MSNQVPITEQSWFVSIEVEQEAKKVVVYSSDVEAAKATLPKSWMGFTIEVRQGQG